MTGITKDFLYSLRSLGRRPMFMAMVVLTLGLGFGANTAIFSFVRGVLLRPLPFPEPQRLAMIWERNETLGLEDNVVSPANFVDWREKSGSFSALAGLWQRTMNLTGLEEPEEVELAIASHDVFELLRLPAVAGRLFADSDVQPGAFTGQVVVLSHSYWLQRFGGDPGVVGRSLQLDGISLSVIGVVDRAAELVAPSADLWAPTTFEWADHRQGRAIRVLGRLAPGVDLVQAQAELDLLESHLAEAVPEFNSGWGARAVPLKRQLTGELRPALLILLGAVLLLLLIACTNTANLMISRAADRDQEIAVRVSLGADPPRILRLLLVESIVLNLAAVALGLLLAIVAIRSLVALVPPNLEIPRLEEVGIDAYVLVFSLLLATVTSLLFGLTPVLGVRRLHLVDRLKEGGRGGVGSSRTQWLRPSLVVAETAIALMLVLGAGLLIRSFVELRRVNVGMDLDNILTARVALPGGTYREPERKIAFFEGARERLASLPGVLSASGIQWLPLAGQRSMTACLPEGHPPPKAGQEPLTEVQVVLPDYFRTTGIPVVAGRPLDDRDHAEASPTALVNRTFAQRFWPGGEAVGKHLSYDWGEWISVEVVGVVGDVHFMGVDRVVQPAIFRSFAQQPGPQMSLVMRFRGDPNALIPAVSREIRALDPQLPISSFGTFESLYSSSLARPRLNTLLLSAFSSLALILSAIGIYGVLAYIVSQRTREIGLRLAFGARRRDVLRLILVRGLALSAIGIGIGLILSVGLGRVLRSLLFGISTTDPATFVLVPVLLVLVALAACLFPAWRASRVEPIEALRYE